METTTNPGAGATTHTPEEPGRSGDEPTLRGSRALAGPGAAGPAPVLRYLTERGWWITSGTDGAVYVWSPRGAFLAFLPESGLRSESGERVLWQVGVRQSPLDVSTCDWLGGRLVPGPVWSAYLGDHTPSEALIQLVIWLDDPSRWVQASTGLEA